MTRVYRRARDRTRRRHHRRRRRHRGVDRRVAALEAAGWRGSRPAPRTSGPSDRARAGGDARARRRRRGAAALARLASSTLAAARLAVADAGMVAGLGAPRPRRRHRARATCARRSRSPTAISRAAPPGSRRCCFPNTVMNTMAAATAIAVGARDALADASTPRRWPASSRSRARPRRVAAGRVPAASWPEASTRSIRTVAAVLTEAGAALVARGEGAVFVVLEPYEAAVARGAQFAGRDSAAPRRARSGARRTAVGRRVSPRVVGRALTEARVDAASLLGRLRAASRGRRRAMPGNRVCSRRRWGPRMPRLAHRCGTHCFGAQLRAAGPSSSMTRRRTPTGRASCTVSPAAAIATVGACVGGGSAACPPNFA